MVQVVGGLFFDGDKFFICQRPSCKNRGLLWEFVGGKVENGETKEQALIRECKEELDALICVKDEFMAVNFSYPDIEITLTIFNAEFITEPKKIEHNDIKWIKVSEIDGYDFCPADKDILVKIKNIYSK